jgi:hypothetical protein
MSDIDEKNELCIQDALTARHKEDGAVQLLGQRRAIVVFKTLLLTLGAPMIVTSSISISPKHENY